MSEEPILAASKLTYDFQKDTADLRYLAEGFSVTGNERVAKILDNIAASIENRAVHIRNFINQQLTKDCAQGAANIGQLLSLALKMSGEKDK